MHDGQSEADRRGYEQQLELGASAPQRWREQALALWLRGSPEDAVAFYAVSFDVGVGEAIATLRRLAREHA